jgi:hypothetical protein
MDIFLQQAFTHRLVRLKVGEKLCAHIQLRHCSGCATWQSMSESVIRNAEANRKGRLDCRGPLRGPRNDGLEGERMGFLYSHFPWQGISLHF